MALSDASSASRLLAGGTDLLVEIEAGRTLPDLVVDVRGVGELRAIRFDADGLSIGALTTCTDLVRSDAVRAHADILVQAAWTVGAEQIRNRATIGGNLGTASPAADLVPVLFALDARVELASLRGTRQVRVREFVTGYRTTLRAHDELITRVLVPTRPPAERRAFRKVGTRRAQSISKIVVALALDVEDEHIVQVSGAAGSVAERTVELPNLGMLLGARVEALVKHHDYLLGITHISAQRDTRPRDDVRSTSEYRQAVLANVLARLVLNLVSH